MLKMTVILSRKLCKWSFLFVIVLILFNSNLALAEFGDNIDQDSKCPIQLITISPLRNIARNVIIETSKASFRKEYSPSQIEDLQRQLEHLSIIKFQNGMTRFMLKLVLRTSEGQLDLLRSRLTTNMIHRFSMFEDKIERLEAKNSLYDIFKNGTLLGGIFAKNGDRDRRMALIKIRLVIMEAFPNTFLDFVNGKAVEDNSRYTDILRLGSGLGPENHTQRRRFLDALNQDLESIAVESQREIQEHERIARRIIYPNYENTEELNTRMQDFANSRMLENRMLGDGYERDHVRNSLLKGRFISSGR